MKTNCCPNILPLLVIMVLLFNGCHKETSYDDLPTPIEVGLHEFFKGQDRYFSVSFRTIENYPCNNFEIMSSLKNLSEGFEVVLLGLFVPNTCISVVGPANGYNDLKEMDPGSFSLNFSYGQKKVNSLIEITEQELIVSFESQDQEFLYFPDTRIHRLESHYFWGSMQNTGQPGDEPADMFIKEIMNLGGWDPQLDDGHYGFFRINSGRLFLDPYDSLLFDDNQRTFVFCWEGDFEEITNIASSFADDLEINIFSAQGHNYKNQ